MRNLKVIPACIFGIVLGLLIIFPNQTSAQNLTRTITGIISDQTAPLSGVTISNTNSKQKIQSDINGKFSTTANDDDILIVSFPGLQSAEIKVSTDAAYKITLLESTEPDLLAYAKDKETKKYVAPKKVKKSETDTTVGRSLVQLVATAIAN